LISHVIGLTESDKCSKYLLYTTQVNTAFGARRLASSEVISQVLFTSEHRAARETLKIDHFPVNCYRYSSFCYLFKWYTLKQLFTSVSVNTGGYLPPHFAAQQISTTIHLHLSEQLLMIRFTFIFVAKEKRRTFACH